MFEGPPPPGCVLREFSMSKGLPPTEHAKSQDQSTSDALEAQADRTQEGCGRGLVGCGRSLVGCSSEKDSGSSDNGLDRQQTDAGVLRCGGGKAPGGQDGSNRAPRRRTETNAPRVVPPGSGDVSHIYIIQNLMLNQERSMVPGTVVDKADLKQNRSQLLWTNPRGGSGGPRAGQAVLLQQTGMVPAPPRPAQPRAKTQPRIALVLGTGKRKPGSFLRIAPHPGKTPPENTSPHRDLRHRSERVLCPEAKREEPASTPSSFRLPPTSSPLSGERQTSPGSSSISSSSSSSASRATKGLPGAGPTGAARYRRFLNTMKVLKQSGLLDITMRTRELMRRSTATEQDIGQLGQHTRLLCQLADGRPGTGRGRGAAEEPPSGSPPWERLQRAMAQSGGYPSLQILHRELTVSPSPGPNQNTAAGSEPSGKVTVMPPDSSTG